MKQLSNKIIYGWRATKSFQTLIRMNMLEDKMKHLCSVVLLSLVATSVACGKKEEKAHVPSQGSAVLVSAATVEKGEITRYGEGIGAVKADRESVVAAKVMGAVKRLNFKEGSRVSAGSILVEIDDREIVAQLGQAEAALSEAQAAYANAEMNFHRTQRLFGQKSAAQQQLDNARMQHETAQARVQQAQANITAIKVMLENTRIQAPFGGTVTEKATEIGEMASPGRALFRIMDDRNLIFEASLSEGDIKNVKIGTKVGVKIDAVEKVVNGKVLRIIPSADLQTHSFTVKVGLPNTEGVLPGMYGRIYIDKGKTSVLLIPASAVVQRGEMTGIYVIEDNVARYRSIKTGAAVDTRLELLSGLTAGEKVVLGGLDRIEDGSIVDLKK